MKVPPTEDELARQLATIAKQSGTDAQKTLDRIAERARLLKFVPEEKWLLRGCGCDTVEVFKPVCSRQFCRRSSLGFTDIDDLDGKLRQLVHLFAGDTFALRTPYGREEMVPA